MAMQFTYLVVGGGIAGVSCVEILHLLHPEETIGLITSSGLVKAVTKSVPITRYLSDLTVEETNADTLKNLCTVIIDHVTEIEPLSRTVSTDKGQHIKYLKLCLCTGASPRKIWFSPHVITIRDTDSVDEFQKKLKTAKKIVIVGNGGIATELIYELKNIEIVWVIKDKHMSATFLDPGAAEFFKDSLNKDESKVSETIFKRMRYDAEGRSGPSLGPDWHTNVKLHGASRDTKIQIEYSCEVERIVDSESDSDEWKTYVKLNNGTTHECDLVVSAIGVIPNSNIQVKGSPFVTGSDQGIEIAHDCTTSIANIFAAGDVASAMWLDQQNWFQMRLWSQAKLMGSYAAKCMVASVKDEPIYMDFAFELFTHMTTFFGFKVILLGRFNGQSLNNDYDILLRVTKGEEYIKIILKDGRMRGAILIGETDIEEMCENLILNQLDLTDIADDLLNPDIDIGDYFD